MKICDSSYLIAFLHPNPQPPQDRHGRPVTQFRERILSLIEDLSAANDIIGIPAPALAETLVRSGPNRGQYMKVLGDSWKFQMVPFDSRAAIEASELIAAIKTTKDKWDTWAKVKFDIQIVAIAKAEGVTLIYSDDHHIETYAKRFNIRVIRICDLPVPPPPQEAVRIDDAKVGAQMNLVLGSPTFGSSEPSTEVQPKEAREGTVIEKEGPVAEVTTNDQLQADPPQRPAVQESDGRAKSEGPGEPGKPDD